MIGQRLGPYRIERELGAGGMGTVYLAHGPKGRVALKVIHSHLLAQPGFFKRFLREAEIGKAVRHPNVVRTLDVDALLVDDRQINFMVMEFVEGQSLRQLLAEIGAVPESLLREIALQVADGLAAIHSRGIIHRDLKPENVMITDDHEVRVMDLGIAKLQEATISITHEGQFAGSVLYAAPEQFGPHDVGPAADLYSLGVLLYELATGENPFFHEEVAAVICAHVGVRPRRASECNPDLSAFFCEVVAVLLAKDPAERFASAEELLQVLREGERSAWWATREGDLLRAMERLPRTGVRRDTALHGRATEIAALHSAWQRAQQGEGNAVVVIGEAGIGKTRLVDAFLSSLDARQAHVLYGSYPPSGGTGGIAEAITDKFGQTGLDRALQPYLTATPSLVGSFAALLTHETAPEGSEPLGGDAYQAVCVHFMRALAAERPLLWVIDDLHFAPAEERNVVLSLARAVAGPRALLLLTARPGLPKEELFALSRLENCARLDLGRLSPREVIELLRDAFRSDALAERLGGKIAYKSDGVPFFVFEMIRGLREAKLIRESPDGSYVESEVIEAIEVPTAVRDLIEARLRDLSREERELLDLGAVLGYEFDPDLVARVQERRRIRVLQDLVTIERRSGIVRGAAARYRFDHHQIQEVVYGSLSDGVRAEYHRAMAEACRQRVADVEPEEVPGETAAFLAHHYLKGSGPAEGLPFLAPALGWLERGYRNDAALELADAALALREGVTAARRIDLLLRKADRLEVLGRQVPERAALDEAVAVAEETGDAGLRAATHRRLGHHLERAHAVPEALVELERGLALAREAGDRGVEMAAYGCLAHVEWMQGNHDASQGYLNLQLAMARERGDRLVEAQIVGNLGNLEIALGRNEEARVAYERQRDRAREAGNRRSEATALGNLGLALERLGRLDEARTCQEALLALAGEIGDRRHESRACNNLGTLALLRGDLEEARRQYERRLVLGRETGDREAEAGALGNIALVLRRQGRWADALVWLGRYRDLARDVGYHYGESNAEQNLGNVLLACGAIGEAQAAYDRSLEIARTVGYRNAEGTLLLGHATLLDRRGEAEKAARLRDEGLAMLRGFREQVWVVQALMARAHAGHGGVEAARADVREALALARDLRLPAHEVTALTLLAKLGGGSVREAEEAYRRAEAQLSVDDRMEVHLGLWEAGGNPAHLKAAYDLLCRVREQAPATYRDTMVEHVPLHRAIARAWGELRS